MPNNYQMLDAHWRYKSRYQAYSTRNWIIALGCVITHAWTNAARKSIPTAPVCLEEAAAVVNSKKFLFPKDKSGYDATVRRRPAVW